MQDDDNRLTWDIPPDDPYAPQQPAQPPAHGWTDPDSTPPGWLYDQHMVPPPMSEPGLYWGWNGSQWETRQMPRAQTPPQSAAPPNTETWGDGGYSGGGGNSGGFSMGGPPQPNYPGYESAGAFAPRHATFNFDPYTASSWTDAENEPGFKAARTQLRKQIEAGAAHNGMVRSGMTIGDLYSNLDALSQQNMKSFDDRRYRNWSGNVEASRNKFLDEYGIDRDTFGFHATDVDRKNNFDFNVADSSFKAALDAWKTQVNALTSLSRPVE